MFINKCLRHKQEKNFYNLRPASDLFPITYSFPYKGEKERYKHLNAEFQRIARRDKKAFFSNQCKEIEENNRMGKDPDAGKDCRQEEKGANRE